MQRAAVVAGRADLVAGVRAAGGFGWGGGRDLARGGGGSGGGLGGDGLGGGGCGCGGGRGVGARERGGAEDPGDLAERHRWVVSCCGRGCGCGGVREGRKLLITW